MSKKTVARLFLFVATVSVFIIDFSGKAGAFVKPQWLKECVYDSQGDVAFYTCDYIDRDEECSALNC